VFSIDRCPSFRLRRTQEYCFLKIIANLHFAYSKTRESEPFLLSTFFFLRFNSDQHAMPITKYTTGALCD
jgi:hypothetical protein